VPSRARRALTVTVSVLLVLGLVLALTGVWLALRLGPSGQADVTVSTPSSSAIVVPPSYVNAVDTPFQVQARRRDGGPVWIGVAPQGDAAALFATGAHSRLTALRYLSGSAELRSSGSGALPSVVGSDIWRATSSGSGRADLVVAQGGGPLTVVVASGGEEPLKDVTTTLLWNNRTWFFEALLLAVVGGIVAAFAFGYLWQRRNGPPEASDVAAGNTDTAAGNTDTAAGSTDTAAGSTDTAAGNTDTAAGNTDTAGDTQTDTGTDTQAVTR